MLKLLCIQKDIVHDKFKAPIIVHLYKNPGSLWDPSNFHPISLSPVIAKKLEKRIYKRLYNYLNKFRILYNKQFGLRCKKTTEN